MKKKGKKAMIKIKLSSGAEAKISDKSLDKVSKHKWHQSGRYAYTSIWWNGKNVNLLMHRLILDYPDGQVDHIDNDGLNNQLENLRVVPASVNSRNPNNKQTRNTSGVVGVTWNKRAGKWQVTYCVCGKNYFLGRYETLEEAKNAREKGKKELDETYKHYGL